MCDVQEYCTGKTGGGNKTAQQSMDKNIEPQIQTIWMAGRLCRIFGESIITRQDKELHRNSGKTPKENDLQG